MSDNINVTQESEAAEEFSLKDFLACCLSKWRWFTVSIVLFCCLGVLYVLRQQPVYSRSMELLIKDQDGGGGVADISNAFSSLGLVSSNTNVNNMIGGAVLVAIAEGYAFAAKAGIDLQTTFDATRGGFAGGPLYDNKVPKLIRRDYEPGARIAVHRKDILNAKHYAHHLGVDLPMTDVVLHVMDWMADNGHINEDQIAMVKYYEDKMDVTVGQDA